MQGCKVLVFCRTPTLGLENLGTPDSDSGHKKTQTPTPDPKSDSWTYCVA